MIKITVQVLSNLYTNKKFRFNIDVGLLRISIKFVGKNDFQKMCEVIHILNLIYVNNNKISNYYLKYFKKTESLSREFYLFLAKFNKEMDLLIILFFVEF